VISLFSDSIEKIVALASLMPIVASMGGVSGTQTLTIMVRQMALGELKLENAAGAIIKEMMIALINGTVFACLAGALAWAWFKTPLLGAVIGMAMLANMLYAGFFGAGIPLILKRFGIDPAVASAVLLITVTDVAGFFTFLSLATIILL
jgi:magnesium transporter